MTVYDRWHTRTGDAPCREHRGRGLYPSSVHGRGDRWQVRWRDDAGKQHKRNFPVREGRDPSRHADAFDAKVTRDLHTGDYIDPDAGDITFAAFAEDWRRTRSQDPNTAAALERRLRLHAYEGEPGSGRTPKGGVAIGQRRMRELSARPSLIAAWLAACPLRDKTLVFGDVGAIFRAAVDDGIVRRDPARAASVARPRRGSGKARPWTLHQVEAMAMALPPRFEIIPWLGAGTGMRQGELFGLAAEDVVFLGRSPHVTVARQVKLVGGRLHFAPVKNRKAHTVPLAPSLAPLLARHMELCPPAEVTLPWHDVRDPAAHGRPVTARLVLSRPDGRALLRPWFNSAVWHPAQATAGITPPGEGKRQPQREDGCHALRHTFASLQLADRVDITRVAAWMGDTPQVVWQTYAHLMPGDDGAAGRAAVDAFFGHSSARPSARYVTVTKESEALCQVRTLAIHLMRLWKGAMARGPYPSRPAVLLPGASRCYPVRPGAMCPLCALPA
jgi:integrase